MLAGPLSVGRVRRAARPASTGTARTERSAGAPARSGWPSRPAGPFPTAGCSASTWRPSAARASASWTRRWSTSRASGDVVRPGRVVVAHRGHHARPGAGDAGAGRPGEDAVLARRRAGAAGRAGPGARRVRPRARGHEARAAPSPVADGGPGRVRRPNLVRYLDEQREATGVLADDRTIVVERFRDELGDWRVCIHSPFGAPVHAPWSQAIETRVRERLGLEVQTMYTDDGIVVRLPEADEAPPAESILFAADEIEDVVVDRLSSSALFAEPVPRERGAGAAAAAPPARPSHAAVAAAPAQRGAAPGGRPLPAVPDRARDVPRVPPGRLRRAGPGRADGPGAAARGAGGRGGHPHAVAVRVVAAVRLRGGVHVRGRRAAGRAAGAGAVARPVGPGRAAGRGPSCAS